MVNVKVAYLRPDYDNLSEWMKDPQNSYIARRGVVFIDGQRYPPHGSIWANPFKIDEAKGMTRVKVMTAYRKYIKKKLESGEIPKAELEKLRGKNLGCW